MKFPPVKKILFLTRNFHPFFSMAAVVGSLFPSTSLQRLSDLFPPLGNFDLSLTRPCFPRIISFHLATPVFWTLAKILLSIFLKLFF